MSERIVRRRMSWRPMTIHDWHFDCYLIVYLDHCISNFGLPHHIIIKLLQPPSETFSPFSLNFVDLIRWKAHIEPVLRDRVFALHELPGYLSACLREAFSAIGTIHNLLLWHSMIVKRIAWRWRPPAVLFTTLEDFVLVDMVTLWEYVGFALTHFWNVVRRIREESFCVSDQYPRFI